LLCADLERLVVFFLVFGSAAGSPDQAAERDESPGLGCQHVQCRFSGRIGEDFGAQARVRIGRIPVRPEDKVKPG